VANIFQLILETIGDIKEEDENDADIFKEALKMAIKKYDGSFDYFW
jgi:DNA replication protein DnaD